jgi:hypothetical protein
MESDGGGALVLVCALPDGGLVWATPDNWRQTFGSLRCDQAAP